MSRRVMTRAELLDLPPTLDIRTAGRAIGIGKTKAYEMAQANTFPVPVLRLGARWRVVTEDLLKLLKIERDSAPPPVY